MGLCSMRAQYFFYLRVGDWLAILRRGSGYPGGYKALRAVGEDECQRTKVALRRITRHLH